MNKYREAVKTLKYLSKFNLGDAHEIRIRNTLIKIGECIHNFPTRDLKERCIYCHKTRAKQPNDTLNG